MQVKSRLTLHLLQYSILRAYYALTTRRNQPTKIEIRSPKKDINAVIINNLPEKSGSSPASVISMPDALKINNAAIENSKMTAVDISVDFQKVFGNAQ